MGLRPVHIVLGSLVLSACSAGGRDQGAYKAAIACHSNVMAASVASEVMSKMNGGAPVDLSKEEGIARSGVFLAGGAAGHTYQEVSKDILASADVERERLLALGPERLPDDMKRSTSALNCLQQYVTRT